MMVYTKPTRKRTFRTFRTEKECARWLKANMHRVCVRAALVNGKAVLVPDVQRRNYDDGAVRFVVNHFVR